VLLEHLIVTRDLFSFQQCTLVKTTRTFNWHGNDERRG